MKIFKNKRTKKSGLESEEFFGFQIKIKDLFRDDEVSFIQFFAKKGVPSFEFDYGNYFLMVKKDEKTAEEWWNKFYRHANGQELFEASSMFAYLGDQYYDWCMKCLKKSASLNFELSKRMLVKMEEHPFKFPEA